MATTSFISAETRQPKLLWGRQQQDLHKGAAEVPPSSSVWPSILEIKPRNGALKLFVFKRYTTPLKSHHCCAKRDPSNKANWDSKCPMLLEL